MNNNHYIDTVYNKDVRPLTKYPDQLARYLVKRFGLKGRLLDVGCGRGDFLYAFQNAGVSAIGVDGEKSFGRKDVIGEIDLETGRLPFEDNSVDVVFNKSVMEHLHHPDNMLKECYRVLKSGGRIISMVPDWQSCMFIYYDDHTHVQPYTKSGLEDCLKIFGFAEVESELFYQLPVVWKYPMVKIICKFLQLFGRVKRVHKNKFYRFSKELMILATGKKE